MTAAGASETGDAGSCERAFVRGRWKARARRGVGRAIAGPAGQRDGTLVALATRRGGLGGLLIVFRGLHDVRRHHHLDHVLSIIRHLFGLPLSSHSKRANEPSRLLAASQPDWLADLLRSRERES